MKRTYSLILTLPFVAVLLLSNESYAQDYPEHLTLIGHTFSVNSVTFSPNGSTLASGGNDGTIRLWDATTGIHQKTLTGHTDSVLTINFSPNGSILASGGYDSSIRLWNAATSRHIETVHAHKSAVYSIVFSPDSLTLASSSADRTIRFWDAATAIHKKSFAEGTDNFHGIVFNPNGHILASSSYDGNTQLWSVVTSAQRKLTKPAAFEINDLNEERHFQRRLLHVEYTTASNYDRLYNNTLPTRSVHSIAFSPNGRLIASGGLIDIHLWDAATGEYIKTLIGHTR